MTDKDPFPLCAAAGLKTKTNILQIEDTTFTTSSDQWIKASAVERMLESAPVVSGQIVVDGFYFGSDKKIKDTHTSRLVCIQPLKPANTAEGLLKELVAAWDDSSKEMPLRELIHTRARALLEGCSHSDTQIWEPHLAGARKCLNCGMVYNPNHTPKWHHEK